MALISFRNALMAGKKLPYDNEVEYLESTGTQWIDTGVSASSDDEFQMVYYYNEQSAGYSFGVVNASNGANVWHTFVNGGVALFGTGGFYNLNMMQSNGVNTLDLRLHRVQINGQSKTTTGTFDDTITGDNIKVFGAGSNYGKLRIGAFRHYRNSVLVRDFIPVRNGTVGYLYDRVSGKLFGNAGTGAFSYGNDLKYPIPA